MLFLSKRYYDFKERALGSYLIYKMTSIKDDKLYLFTPDSVRLLLKQILNKYPLNRGAGQPLLKAKSLRRDTGIVLEASALPFLG